MPVESITTHRALLNKREGAQSSWPHPKRGKESLYPIPLPQVRSRFKIKRDDAIFCIGSCFAREIEKTLSKLGFNVLTSKISVSSGSEFENLSPDVFLNRYNVPSILSELNLAFSPESLERKYLVEISEGKFRDYLLAADYVTAAANDLLEIRKKYADQISKIREANVVILTLGLSEVWFDKMDGVYLNKCPDPKILKCYPDRFELRILDYEDTVKGLESIRKILVENLDEEIKILVTVSPVPLLSTFRDVSVFEANAYSKAVLRSAVDSFLKIHENISYFPSYEMVSLASPDLVWGGRGDYRHVNRDFVEVIMSHALDALLDPPLDSIKALKVESMARTLFNSGKINDALYVIDENKGINSVGIDKIRKKCELVISTGKRGGSQDVFYLKFERWFFTRVLGSKKLDKYINSRYAFFADSKYRLLRVWGDLTR